VEGEYSVRVDHDLSAETEHLNAVIAGDLSVAEYERYALAATFRWARTNIPHYRDSWRGLPDAASREDLLAFPMLDPAMLHSYDQPLLAEPVETDFVVVSSGTTSGKNKILHRSFLEYEQLTRFRDWWYPKMGYSFDKSPEDARFVAIDDRHGIRYVEPRRGPLRMMNFPLFQESHFGVAKHVLQRFGADAEDRRVVELRGPYPKIRLLTVYAAEQGWRPAEWSAVERVMAGAFFTTSRWRNLFAEVWGASAVQEYGQTEFHQSYANECGECGWFHFAPAVIEELVQPVDSSVPVTEGVGRLLMTHLVPMSLRQVLIRYDTGDLVERSGICAATNLVRYRPIGRLANTLWLESPRGRIPLAPSHFIEAVDIAEAAFEVVDRMQYSNVTSMQDIGAPLFWASLQPAAAGRPPRVILEIELKQELPGSRIRAVQERVAGTLFADDPDLRDLVEQSELDVTVDLVSPGKLDQVVRG
jgi:phenylacetate-coenzyme A ligase PaaK-like adenylate-forming protein